MVETLFFDLDNTLLDFNRAERAAIAKTLKSFHIAPEPSVLKRYSELNLAQWKLLEQGKIVTTVARAKEVRSAAEKMITLGKAGTLHTKRQVYGYITKEDVAKKLFDDIAPKYADKNGGYTRIIKIGPRRGDAAEMAVIELV